MVISLAIIWGLAGLLWHGVGSYWKNKLITEARKKELEAEKASRPPWTIKKYLRRIAGHAVLVGIPGLLIIDGIVFRIGLLYSPWLSFPSLYDDYVQAAGLLLSILGLVIMYGVGRIIMEQVYAKAQEERKMMSTGIYAYVRHPFYVHFAILPVGLVLLTLNYLTILLVLVYATPWAFMREIREEEQELLKKYGKEYEEYMKRTGRLFPKIRR